MTKFILAFTTAVLFSYFQAGSCRTPQTDGWVEMGGPDHLTSLVIFFRKDTEPKEIESFYKTVLSKPSPYGNNTGLAMANGTAGRFRVLNGGYVGVGVNFSISSTVEERENLKTKIRESPIVYRVYENVVPKDIHDL